MKVKNKFLNVLLDSTSLMIALAIDLSLNIISMYIIAPGPIEAIGFIGMAIIVVLFGVRSWIKGGWNGKALWFIFAVIAIFFDASFVLESTKVQTQTIGIMITQESDMELQRIQAELTAQTTKINELIDQQRISFNRVTLDNLAEQIKAEQLTKNKYETAYNERLNRAESGKLTKQARSVRSGLKADDIFYAIPNAINEHRYIPLVVFLVLFVGLQLTIITAATNSIVTPVRQKYIGVPPIPEDVDKVKWHKKIDNWIAIVWRNDSPSLPSEEDFFEMMKVMKKPLTKVEYNRIMRAAHHQKVIEDGVIKIMDKKEVKERILLDKVLV